MNYNQFLESKQQSINGVVFDPVYIPDIAFDFQQSIIEKAVKKGRMAVFADMGASLMVIFNGLRALK